MKSVAAAFAALLFLSLAIPPDALAQPPRRPFSSRTRAESWRRRGRGAKARSCS